MFFKTDKQTLQEDQQYIVTTRLSVNIMRSTESQCSTGMTQWGI